MSDQHPFYSEIEGRYINPKVSRGEKIEMIESIPGMYYRLWHSRSREEAGENLKVREAFEYAKALKIPHEELWRLLKKHFG